MVKKLLVAFTLSLLLIGFVSAFSVSISNPIQGNNYSDNVTKVDWSYSGLNKSDVGNVWYDINGVVSNFPSYTDPDTIMTINMNSQEEDNTVIVYVNSTLGEVQNATVNFWVDSIFPELSVLTPASDPYYTNSNTISISALLDETNPSFDLFGRAVLLKLYVGSTFFNQWWMNFNSATNVSTFSYSPLVEGAYTYVLVTEDTMGHSTNVSGEYILDMTAPTLTLNGSSNITMEFNTSYVELGATASDNLEGDISSMIVIDSSALDVNTIGTHNITYDVSDSAGNAAPTEIRTVTVVDSTAPVITLIGSNPQTIIVGSAYTELGANASDNYDGDLTANITIDSSEVNTSAIGTYTVYYSVNDSFGNSALINRTVNVLDNVAPIITLNGNSTITLERAVDTYTELGANASDNYDGDLTANITIDSSAVNTNVAGTYNVYYYVEDSSGNNDTEVRIVNVIDTIAPSITIVSPLDNTTYIVNSVNLEVSSDEAGTWKYSLNGAANLTFTPNTSITGLANGDYELIVYITDASGNENSSSLNFTINVPTYSGSSSGGGGSCKTIYECTEWSEWSACEDFQMTRTCIAWDKVRCRKGITLEEVKVLTETDNCIVDVPRDTTQDLEVVAPIEEPQENPGFFGRITGAVTGFAGSGPGKTIVVILAGLSLVFGVVHFMKKRSSTILLE